MADQLLSGWGRALWSRSSVAWPTTAADVVKQFKANPGPMIARGLGRSYGDQATCGGGLVLDMTSQAGELVPNADGRIAVPGGVSIDALLRAIVPAGWFMPVTPGTRHVTVGGAIAADIHGKNHHVDGSIASYVESMSIVVGDGSVLECSANSNSELFWATVGGLGLTGVIVEATLQLSPIESSQVLVDTTRFAELDPLLGAMIEADSVSPFSVSWIDLAGKRSAGRSILTTARFANADELNSSDGDPLAYDPNERLSTPRWLPNGLLRRSTVRIFNEAWFRASPKKRVGQQQSIGRYFHPLDAIAGWNRIYGPQGFLQWQMVVPDGQEHVLRTCVETFSSNHTPCFLAVLKRLGPANPGPLSFPLQGWTLAADIPALVPGLNQQLDELDRMVAACGGRIYLAKDSRLDPNLVSAMYPRVDEWRRVRDQFDPNHRFASDMSRRLGL